MTQENNRKKTKQSRGWYVLHTYTGQEDSVRKDIMSRVHSMGLDDYVFDVIVPKETQYSIKNGKTVEEQKKTFSGYILIDMIITDESWYVIRNTPNVTGFVGAGKIPTAISQDELEAIKSRMNNEKSTYNADFTPDDEVQIIEGPFTGNKGMVQMIDKQKGMLKISMDVFGRSTLIELSFDQVKKQ